MPRPDSWRRPARTAPWLVLGIALVSLTSAWGAPVSSVNAGPVTAPSHGGAAPVAPTIPATPPSAPKYYHLTPGIAAQGASDAYCSYSSTSVPPTVDRYCFPQAQNPSALLLANGDIAVAYSILTNHTSTTCSAPANETNSRVGVSVSTDNGTSFGGITYLGNDTCPYVNAIEPSFGVSSTGVVDGVFVEENYSNLTTPISPGLPPNYADRSTDALGFVQSKDNATTWSAVRTILAAGNIARPALATFGETIYVTYTDIANGTGAIGQAPGMPRANPVAEAVRMIVSTDGGTTWTTPITLPSENPAENYTSYGASIAVSAGGTVAVAYATNRSCLQTYTSYPCTASGFYWTYGENVVVATTDDNGTTWHGPTTVGPAAGEAGCYDYDNETPGTYPYPEPCLSYLFELTPQTTITFGATNQTIYVAWSGEHPPYYYFEENSNVSAAVSTNGGRSWNSTVVQNPSLYNVDTGQEYSTPALGFSAGRVYLAYLEKNGTSCFISIYCSLLESSYIEWATSSTNGLNWTSPTFVALAFGGQEYSLTNWYDSFSGYTGSVTFTAAGHPLLAFALDQRPVSRQSVVGNTTYTEFDFGTTLDVAVAGVGPTVNLTFDLVGAPSSTAWSFTVDGQTFNVPSTSTSQLVTGVPAGQYVKIDGPKAISTGFWTELAFVASVPELSTFTANTTVDFNATTEYGLAFAYAPGSYTDYCMCLSLNGAYYIAIPDGIYGYIQEPLFPWYFPKGQQLTVQPQLNQGADPTLYYVGNGTGSYTGPGAWANLTMDAPINETVWNGLLGNSSLGVAAAGLPTGTAFNFSVDGTGYAGIEGTTTYVNNLPVGPHVVSNGWAAGTGGYEWIATPSSSTYVVPFETSVTLTFADVDLSSALGTVSFHAMGLPAGNVWTVSFNGTLRTSSTPWINVTSRSGTFPFVSYSSVSSSGSSGFAPTTVGPSVTVASGGTLAVNFTPAYEVQVSAGVGGRVAGPASQWVAPNATVALNASALAGYRFVEWSGTGSGSYSGTLLATNLTVLGPTVETAVFAALPSARFNLTFTEQGVPAQGEWSVDLSGQSFATNQTTLAIGDLYSCSSGPSGLYALTVPDATNATTGGIRYVPGTVNTTVCTTGSTSVALGFSTQYLVNVTASESTAQATATCGLLVGTSVWCDAATNVGLSAPPVPGDTFTGWVGTGPGAYTGTTADPSFVPTGPVSELATYVPTPVPPTYSLTLATRPGFVTGTTWQATVSGKTYASTAPTLVVLGLSNGSLSVALSGATSPDDGTQYTPVATPLAVQIAGNTSKTVNYTVAFRGEVSAAGTGTVGPTSGWFPANATVRLSAVPSSGQTFEGWAGTGASYSGTNPNATFEATGPFTEVATFAPTAAPVSTTTTTTSSFWSNPAVWAGLAIAGLVVGLVAGLLVTRRGPPPSRAPEPTVGDPAGPPDAPYSEGP